MGTNFYWIDNPDKLEEDSIEIHIGKRSAAGLYCWDCKQTLCKDGEKEVHSGGKRNSSFSALPPLFRRDEAKWYSACPKCGKTFEDNGMKSAGAVELGFAKSADVPHTGVSSCSSFTWSQNEHKEKLAELSKDESGRLVVQDEYGDEFTATQFLKDELYNVAIEFELRREFS